MTLDQQTLFGEADCDPELDQYFTSPDAAGRIAEWTQRRHPWARRFLEPAAGRGALVKALLDLSPAVNVEAWEIDPRMMRDLRGVSPRCTAHLGDFLAVDISERRWDGAVMNTPYRQNLDALIALKASHRCEFVVAVMRAVAKHTAQKWEALWRHVDIKAEVAFIERPDFGGDYTAKTDFIVVDLESRSTPLNRGEPMPPHPAEWW